MRPNRVICLQLLADAMSRADFRPGCIEVATLNTCCPLKSHAHVVEPLYLSKQELR